MNKIKKFSKLIHFLIKKSMFGFSVNEEPWFGSKDAVAYFDDLLRNAKYYVEFGSGGSTLLAAKVGVPFSTVESDRVFLSAVKQKISSIGLFDQTKQVYNFINIGLTGPLGKPVVFFPNQKGRLATFRKYSDLPSAPKGIVGLPDLILVDGRFRVACALKVIRDLMHSDGWTLIVDDYSLRHSYSIIADFAEKKAMIGRMAIFSKMKEINDEALAAAIEKYETIPT